MPKLKLDFWSTGRILKLQSQNIEETAAFHLLAWSSQFSLFITYCCLKGVSNIFFLMPMSGIASGEATLSFV